MILYFLIPLFAILSFLFVDCFRIKVYLFKTKSNLAIFLAFIFPFILFAFRDVSIGIDTQTYLNYLDAIQGLPFKQVIMDKTFEAGYTFFNYLVSRLPNYKFAFLILTGLIINLLYAKSIAILSPMPLASILIYFFICNFLYNLNTLRQGIAVGVILFSLQYLMKGNYKKYILLVMVACLIHTFMIIFIPIVVPVVLIKERKYLIAFCATCVVLVFIALEAVHVIAQRFFPHFAYYFRHTDRFARRFGIMSLAYVLLDLFIFGLLVISYKKYTQKDAIFCLDKAECASQRSRLLNFLCIMFSLGAASLIKMNSFGIFLRIAQCFHTFLIFGIPYGIMTIKNRYTRYITLTVILLCTFAYYFYVVVSNMYSIVPYKFG
jgi:transmembrane protein EpsG